MLTDTTVKSLKAKEKDYKMTDAHGLYVHVAKTGRKTFRYDYTQGGKRNTRVIGNYPDVSLKEARKALEAFKETLKKEYVHIPTFEAIANEYLGKKTHISDSTREKHLYWLSSLIPVIGNKLINELTTPFLLSVCQDIQANHGNEKGLRCARLIRDIFTLTINKGIILHNPCQTVPNALETPKTNHLAAITDKTELGKLIRAIRDYKGDTTTKIALTILPYVFTRQSELREARWQEIDFDKCLWTIPAERIKTRTSHIVPLSRQVVAALSSLKSLNLPSDYIFPQMSNMTKPLSDGTFNSALRRLGFPSHIHTAHGFRTTASTLLHDNNYPSHLIEKQLAHTDKNAIRGIYNRAEYLPERIAMMQAWADMLDDISES